MNQEEFARNAKEYIQLKERMAQIADEAKEKKTPIKDRVESLEESVRAFLVESEVDICVVGDYNLKVASVKKRGPLNRKTLTSALTGYFSDPEEVSRCIAFIEESLGEEDVQVLRKTRRRATGSPPGPPAVDGNDSD